MENPDSPSNWEPYDLLDTDENESLDKKTTFPLVNLLDADENKTPEKKTTFPLANSLDNNENKSPEKKTTFSIANVLTAVSHTSSPFVATFLLVHLAAPVIANVGGTSAASRTMLLGREYYQTNFGETYLVLGPIIVHTLAGISKRLLLRLRPFPKSSSYPPSNPATTPTQRPLTSILSLAGYATALLFLPIHYLTHRSYPALSTDPAISSVGPSSLDYEYVKFGLHTWPWRSGLLYTGLVTFTALHVADGVTIIWNTWFKKWCVSWGTDLSSSSRARKRRVIAIGGVVLPVIMGLVAMAREPPMLMSFVANRYKAAYLKSFVFQI